MRGAPLALARLSSVSAAATLFLAACGGGAAQPTAAPAAPATTAPAKPTTAAAASPAASPAAAARSMAQYVRSFAQRYGPGGTFWSQNPRLPTCRLRAMKLGTNRTFRCNGCRTRRICTGQLHPPTRRSTRRQGPRFIRLIHPAWR